MGLPLDISFSTLLLLPSKELSFSFPLPVSGLCVWLGPRGVRVILFPFSLKE